MILPICFTLIKLEYKKTLPKIVAGKLPLLNTNFPDIHFEQTQTNHQKFKNLNQQNYQSFFRLLAPWS